MRSTIQSILLIVLIFNTLASIFVIIYERQRAEKTTSWLLIILTFPLIGFIAYILLGRNWVKPDAIKPHSPHSSDSTNEVIQQFNLEEHIPLIKLIQTNSNANLHANNQITIFKDGLEKFAALKEELLKAKHHIHLEYYTIESDKIGTEIKDLLIKKSKEGVSVRIVMDGFGSSKLSRSYLKELEDSGIATAQISYSIFDIFHRARPIIGYRDHRKLAVIDGKVGFIGGINIGDEYISNSEFGYWRDTHLMIKGQSVHAVQDVFLHKYNNIMKSKGVSLDESNLPLYYPPAEPGTGATPLQIIKSGPDTKYYSALQLILKMITMAKDHIYITTPYFVPPHSILEAIKMASTSGVDVKILFPDQCDELLMHHASKNHLYELLKYGVKVYLYDKNSFVHAKTITIDSKFCTIGSINVDSLSLEYNYEANAVIYDSAAALQLEELFLEDIKHSTIMPEDYYNSIPFYLRVFQNLLRVLSAIL